MSNFENPLSSPTLNASAHTPQRHKHAATDAGNGEEFETFNDLYDRAISAFGDRPTAALETEWIRSYRERPEATIAAVDRAIAAWKAGGVYSPLGVLKAELERAEKRADVPKPEKGSARDKAIRRAERRIALAGQHYETEDELIRDFFGPPMLSASVEDLERLERDTSDRPGREFYGRLLKLAIERTRTEGQQRIEGTPAILAAYDTPELRSRMAALWREHHPAPAETWDDEDA